MDFTPAMIFVLFLILAAEFVNGWTDAPNAIATVVATRVLTPAQAIVLAAILNSIGAFSGTAVAVTIGKGIVQPEMITPLVVGAAMAGIVVWSTIAWYFGLPTSESHALVSGLAGASLAVAGPSVLLISGWIKVFIGLGFSTFLGFFFAFALMWIIAKIFVRTKPRIVRAIFSKLQVLSACFMAFSHGSNDGQKFIGVFTLALLLFGFLESFTVPFWVILICATTMGLGTAIGGWRIIKTIGFRLTKLETHHGFSAETAAASAIVIASHFGIPLSTTHTIGTAIAGVGASQRFSSVRWDTGKDIVTAWILTFPICALIGWAAVKIALLVF